MKVTCDYCANQYEDTAKNCPSCGAPNNFIRVANGEPTTIEELKQWYTSHNLPPENVTRYFIGKDIKEPKAFGIYFDGTDYIVYKNKADGTRAVRYQGGDEKYAVNELYQRLKVDIVNQKSNQRFNGAGFNPGNNENNAVNNPYGGWTPPQNNRKNSGGSSALKIILFIVVVVVIIRLISACVAAFPSSGGSSSSYNSGYGSSYSSDYYDDDDSDSGWSFDYDSDDDWGSDWDSDSSWDSFDSWDSGGSDWGSDW